MIYKFYDTCSLLLKVNNLWDENEQIVISSITLEELEKIKSSANKDVDVKFAARRLINELDNCIDELSIVFWDDDLFVEGIFDKATYIRNNDMKIIMCANSFYQSLKPEDEMIFVTNDIFCKELARTILSCDIESYKEEKYTYTGYKEVTLNEEEMITFYSSPFKNMYDLYINEYLIIKDIEGNVVDKLCWTGDGYRPLSYNNFKSAFFGDVKPIKGDIY